MNNVLFTDISSLFNPKSIALISDAENSVSRESIIFKNITDGKYSGKIFPVNIQKSNLIFNRYYNSINEIDKSIDTAVIVMPLEKCVNEIKDCIKKDVKNIQLISTSSENEKNIYTVKYILKLASENKINITVLSGLGIYSSGCSMNSTLSVSKITPGHTAILTY